MFKGTDELQVKFSTGSHLIAGICTPHRHHEKRHLLKTIPDGMRCVHSKPDAPIPLVTAATCPPLTVANGKASSDSPSKTMETVNITCEDGYKKVGTIATCSPSGPGKAAWTNIPICTGRSLAGFQGHRHT